MPFNAFQHKLALSYYLVQFLISKVKEVVMALLKREVDSLFAKFESAVYKLSKKLF